MSLKMNISILQTYERRLNEKSFVNYFIIFTCSFWFVLLFTSGTSMGGTWSNETSDNFTDITKQQQQAQPEVIDVPSDESRDNPSEKKKKKETKHLTVRVWFVRWWRCTFPHPFCRLVKTAMSRLRLFFSLEWYRKHLTLHQHRHHFTSTRTHAHAHAHTRPRTHTPTYTLTFVT